MSAVLRVISRLNDNRGRQHFESSLRELFVALNKLMSDSRESMVAVQEALLTYLPSVIGDVMTLYDPLEFTYVLLWCGTHSLRVCLSAENLEKY